MRGAGPRGRVAGVIPTLAIVVIGRNERVRLPRALCAALSAEPACVIYVDSGSTDDSVALARSIPSVIVEVLDNSLPHTAARGRNRGFEIARAQVPNLTHVQFIDGDCVLSDGYIGAALTFFGEAPDVAIVVGKLREEYRDKNVFHRLADMEWESAVGEVRATGGIFMIRADVFEAAGGFDGSVAAGEEFELAVRVRALGHRIMRIDHEMARHDINMQSFGEWWQRAVRSGHSLAEGMYIQAQRGKKAHYKLLGSSVAYGAMLPSAATLLLLPTLGLSLFLLTPHARLWLKVREQRLREGATKDDAAVYATSVVIGKFAEAQGIGRFVKRWLGGELAHGKHMLTRTAKG